MKKIISLLIAAILVCATLVAAVSCGGNEQKTPAASQTPNASTEGKTSSAKTEPASSVTPDAPSDATAEPTPEPSKTTPEPIKTDPETSKAPDPTTETPTETPTETVTPEPTPTLPVDLDAYELVKAGAEKLETLPGYVFTNDTDTQMIIKVMGMTQDASSKVTSVTKIANAGTDNQISETKQTQTSMGTTYDATIYTDKNFVYVDSLGQKIRYAADSDEAAPYMPNSPKELTKQFPAKEPFAGAEVKQNTDGSKTVSIPMSAEQFEQMFGESLSSITDSFAESGATDAKVSYSDIVATFTVLSNGYLGSFNVSLKMHATMTVQGFPMEADATIVTGSVFDNPGSSQEISIVMPSADDYTDASEIPEFDV